MTLRQTLRAGVAAIAVAAAITPGVVAPAGAAPTLGGIEVHVAQAQEFSRVEFHGAASAAVKRDGQTLTLTFPRDADPDIARLRTDPPRWIKTAEKAHLNGRLVVTLT